MALIFHILRVMFCSAIEMKAAKRLRIDYELETAEDRTQRWRSIRVIYFTMFLMSLGFSIIITGVWPYLDKLDPEAGKEFMGYVVGANPFGQMLFSPLVGWWGNKLGSIRLPVIVSLGLFTAASAGYSLLEVFPSHHKYWMVATRFLVGISSASIAVCRSYVSAATMVKERTSAISMVSLAQTLGFVIGPGLQAAVTPLGDRGYSIWSGEGGKKISMNMYTASGWINVFMGVINILLFTPWIFKEKRIATAEAMRSSGKDNEADTWKSMKPDYVGAWTMICAFFVLVFNFVLLETLGTSLVMDQFAWSKSEALYYMGMLMSVGAIVACVTFVAIGPLCRREFLPDNRSIPQSIAVDDDGSPLGCPETQTWCLTTPAMTVSQLLIGYAFTAVGYPIGVTLIQTIFSKLLGPRPQAIADGVWMGFITGSGCLSRVMGPVFVSYIYTSLGTIWTFGITTVMMAASMVWLHVVRHRLKVPEIPKHPPGSSKESRTGNPGKIVKVDVLEMTALSSMQSDEIRENGGLDSAMESDNTSPFLPKEKSVQICRTSTS
ncbi:hypothetical protein J437_LFUL017898 [Ladona fulva]|uniref:Major facilitator superfamily (MFS) profile domain-containing protein n=1 Tax=Ladona fulva TaxID=123851 RepID=A0A8K0P6K9_LADFU|nr:hypothetical protein J437_LFUL017898 [Ladona fulva]